MKLNLGCSDRHLPGHINVDICEPADQIVDLNTRWPWEDGSIDEIVAHDIIEHLPNKIFTMNELWRVLKPGGVAQVKVPTTDGPGAFQDPTHVSYWHRNSFWYYTDGDAHRERFGKAYGIEARFRVAHEQVHVWQGIPTLEIHLQCVKLGVEIRRPGELDGAALVALLETPLVFLGAMRIKNESEWIRESIESQLTVCDKVLVFDDHSTDDTRDIVRSFGDRCILMESPFSGLDEARDKNYILEHLVIANPEWVLWVDGEEVLERNAAEVLRRELIHNTEAGGATLPVAYFWNDREHVRVDGVYADFRRTTLFRIRGQDTAALRFANDGDGPNFHCGTIPLGIRGYVPILNTRIKHYGYLTEQKRHAKYEWYNKIDPGNQEEGAYQHIIEVPGAPCAPGPTVLVPWMEQ